MKNTFKDFLTESAMKNMIKSFDATNMDLKDIHQAFENAGLTDMDGGYQQVVYHGYDKKSKQHVYYILWEDSESSADDEEDQKYIISDLYVALGENGKIECDTGGAPIDGDLTKDEAVKKLASLKKK